MASLLILVDCAVEQNSLEEEASGEKQRASVNPPSAAGQIVIECTETTSVHRKEETNEGTFKLWKGGFSAAYSYVDFISKKNGVVSPTQADITIKKDDNFGFIVEATAKNDRLSDPNLSVEDQSYFVEGLSVILASNNEISVTLSYTKENQVDASKFTLAFNGCRTAASRSDLQSIQSP